LITFSQQTIIPLYGSAQTEIPLQKEVLRRIYNQVTTRSGRTFS